MLGTIDNRRPVGAALALIILLTTAGRIFAEQQQVFAEAISRSFTVATNHNPGGFQEALSHVYTVSVRLHPENTKQVVSRSFTVAVSHNRGIANEAISRAFTVQVAGANPPSITVWRSVRTHTSGLGTEVDLAIELDPARTGNGAGNPTAETRLGGIQRIEVDFDAFVSVVGTVEAEDMTNGGSIMASSQTAFNHEGGTSTLVIEFDPGLPDQTCYKIDLAGVIAGLTGDTDCLVRGLIGDVNGDSSTNNTDKSWVASLNGHPVLPDNIRFDLNLDGSVNNTDKSLVASRNGRGASCP